jgi:hypothetical protein
MVLMLTPITTARGKIIPVSVILTMGIEIAIMPVAKLQMIAVLPILTPCPSMILIQNLNSLYFMVFYSGVVDFL